MTSIDTAQIRPRRSFLFVPGTGLDLFPKAIRTGADIVCIDLEDAIAQQDKDRARADTLALFQSRPDFGRCEVLIRINALRTRDAFADVLGIIDSAAQPTGLMLPKVKSPDEVSLLDELLTGAGSNLRFQVIIETNAGLQACHEIARASPRVDALLFGGVDMAAELRVEPNWEALLYARTRCVHAAASAEVDLIDVPFLDLDDMPGLIRETGMCAAIGMTGKARFIPSNCQSSRTPLRQATNR